MRPVLCGDHAVVDGALKAVDGLPLVEEVEDYRPEHWIAKIIAEIEGAEELPQTVSGFVDGVAGGGRTEPVERLGRRVPAVLHRGAEPQQLFPTPADGAA